MDYTLFFAVVRLIAPSESNVTALIVERSWLYPSLLRAYEIDCQVRVTGQDGRGVRTYEMLRNVEMLRRFSRPPNLALLV